jgi:hypothetical protein
MHAFSWQSMLLLKCIMCCVMYVLLTKGIAAASAAAQPL